MRVFVFRIFRKKVITGFIILSPIAITLYIFYIILRIIQSFVNPIIRIPFFSEWPVSAGYAMSFIIAVLMLWILGVIASNIIGAAFLGFLEKIFMKAPVLNRIYLIMKQIVEVLAKKKTAFKKVVRIDYPRKGIKTIAFITGETDIDGVKYYYLFVPTSPNPTSGFFCMVPVADVEEIGMDVETAMKMIISGGMINR